MRQIAIFKSEPRQSETREIEYKAHWNSCRRTISYIRTNEHTIVSEKCDRESTNDQENTNNYNNTVSTVQRAAL